MPSLAVLQTMITLGADRSSRSLDGTTPLAGPDRRFLVNYHFSHDTFQLSLFSCTFQLALFSRHFSHFSSRHFY